MVNGRHDTKLRDEENFPCLKEHDLVNKCLVKEDYNSLKCEAFFENYRQCRRFWDKLYRERKSMGVKPYLPDKAEREKILQAKKEALNKLKMEYEK